MGILDDIKGKLAGALGGTTAPQGGNAIVNSIFQMLTDPNTGGLQGLVKNFHDKGLGTVVSSWVGTGSNLPITPDQVTQALGANRLQQIAQGAGTHPGAVAPQLAALLPTIIDKLTPTGTVPESSALAQGLAMLRKSMGAAPTAPTAPTK